MTYMQFPDPVTFAGVTAADRALLPGLDGLTIVNSEENEIQMQLGGQWMNVPLYTGARHDGDVLTWKAGLNHWVPASDVNVIGSLTGQRAFFTQDHTKALEVRRTWSTLVATVADTGSMTPYGDHSMTADTSFKVVIDTAGTEDAATFKWSNDGGATYQQELVPVISAIYQRYHLQFGMYVLFTVGNYVLADQWTWTAIATGNQVYDLKIDTQHSTAYLSSTTQVGHNTFATTGTLTIASLNQAALQLNVGGGGATTEISLTAATGDTAIDLAGGAIIRYDVSADSLLFYNAVPDLAFTFDLTALALGTRGMYLSGMPISFSEFDTTLLTNPAANTAKFYPKDVGGLTRPHWKDSVPLEQNMLPLTTKGDLYGFSTTATRLAVGTNGQLLSADSTAATGLSWSTHGSTGDPHTQYLLESLIDAKGDILCGSAADTPTIRAVGTDGQYLIAASGQASGLNWTTHDATGDPHAQYTLNAGTETISGAWTFTNNPRLSVYAIVDHVSSPPVAAAGTGRLYAKSDEQPYWMDTTGTETPLARAAKAQIVTGAWSFQGASVAVNTSTGLNFNSITTPSTPAAGLGYMYGKGAGASVPYWLDSGGTESILTQHNKAETISGAWVFTGTPYFNTNLKTAQIKDAAGTTVMDLNLAGVVPLAITGWTAITQGTLGNLVFSFASTATNDDPASLYIHGRAATTDATVTSCGIITLATSYTHWIRAEVWARRTGGAAGAAEDSACYIVTAGVKNVAGTATLLTGSPTLTVVGEDVAAWTATIDVTGATARVRVTGAANTSITWQSEIKYHTVNT